MQLVMYYIHKSAGGGLVSVMREVTVSQVPIAGDAVMVGEHAYRISSVTWHADFEGAFMHLSDTMATEHLAHRDKQAEFEREGWQRWPAQSFPTLPG